MSDGRGKLEWRQTSELLALIYNANRNPAETTEAHADDYNPYAERRESRSQVSYTTGDLSFWKPACNAE